MRRRMMGLLSQRVCIRVLGFFRVLIACMAAGPGFVTALIAVPSVLFNKYLYSIIGPLKFACTKDT